MEEIGLPLGILRQAIMKMESAMTDLNEAKEEVDDSNGKELLNQVTETLGNMTACIVNLVSQEIDEESFLSETIEMDAIDPYPTNEESSGDLLDGVMEEI